MRLFKYLHPDRIDVVKRARIRFSQPHAFNDPFDLKPNIQGFSTPENWTAKFDGAFPAAVADVYANLPEEVRKNIPLPALQALVAQNLPSLRHESFNMLETLTPRFRALVESKFEEMMGVLCLTEKADNLLMWAHYADSHQGFVIEVDPKNYFFNRRRSPNDEFFFLRKVRYSKDRPTVALSEIESFDTFLTKGLDWKYEQEWRMLAPLSDASTPQNGVRSRNPTIHPTVTIGDVTIGDAPRICWRYCFSPVVSPRTAQASAQVARWAA